MNGFMAVMIGLGNQALSRLHSTWDKLPTKYKKLMSEFEAVLVSYSGCDSFYGIGISVVIDCKK